VILKIFFKVPNVAIGFRKLWIYQIPNLTPKGRNESLVWMAMLRRAKDHMIKLESYRHNGQLCYHW
jgi:hypothetical protein